MAETLELNINGARQLIETDPGRPLLDVLRCDLDLTGTKYGCGEGQCGACTVLLDGRAQRACITPVGAAAGKTIVTIEGLADGDALHPVQEAFLEAEAMQCGYCTSGMVLAAVALLAEQPDPSDAAILAAMNGNICRCGTYPRILAAIRRAAAKLAGGGR